MEEGYPILLLETSQFTLLHSTFTNNYAQIKGSSLYVASQNEQFENNKSFTLNVSIYNSM